FSIFVLPLTIKWRVKTRKTNEKYKSDGHEIHRITRKGEASVSRCVRRQCRDGMVGAALPNRQPARRPHQGGGTRGGRHGDVPAGSPGRIRARLRDRVPA